ncbi:MAG: hypothetical protein ABSD99_06025 [Candidatus Bathyarchaeia archaeon]
MNPKILARLAYRSWYYFRLGYATYLTFILGYVSTLITVYYLAIKNIPSLLDIFPKFVPFAVLATVIGVPFSVAVGWIHLKRSHLFSSETDISVEANPYNYKMMPGKEAVLSTPMMLIQLRILRRLAETNGLLKGREKEEIEGLENMLLTLLKGGYVGEPRRNANF